MGGLTLAEGNWVERGKWGCGRRGKRGICKEIANERNNKCLIVKYTESIFSYCFFKKYLVTYIMYIGTLSACLNTRRGHQIQSQAVASHHVSAGH